MARKYSILIAEDEPIIAEDFAGYIEEYGFDVAGIAPTAKVALQCIEANKPHAVLLDINFGDGPDGIYIAGHIRDRYNIPFVFLTSHTDKATVQRAKSTYPACYLSKPFSGDDLMIAIEIAIFNHMNRPGRS